jgi:hypothetical protein
MPDPNSILVNMGATTATIIPAPGPTTTLLNPPPPYALAFIRVLGLDLSASGTTTVTIQSVGGPFPTRALDILQLTASSNVVLGSHDGPGFGGQYDCDPGCSLSITNSSGTLTGRIRYTIIGAP